MKVATTTFVRKPIYVEAVRITEVNFDAIAKWCHGDICSDTEGPSTDLNKRYIRIRVHNPMTPRQTKAFIGDWILYTEKGYKIYTNNAFTTTFDEAETKEETAA